jgi:CDP-glucose 4,6-dehydratase
MGFGGSHLCEQLLRKGARVYVVDRFRPADSYLVLTGLVDYVDYFPGDVRDLELMKLLLYRYEIEIVFHLAAQPIVPMSVCLPYETLSINTLGTYAVLEAVRTSPLHPSLVFASSGAYYGTTHQHDLILEEQPANRAANLYGASKIAADFGVRCYAQTFGIKAAVCRFMNTYGPGSTNYSTIVPGAIRRLLENEPYDFGERDDGSTVFEFMHVRDMARAYMSLAQNIDAVRGDVFNFSGGNPITIRELTELISRLYDGQERAPLFRGDPRTEPICKCLDCSKAERILGWRPSINLVEGLLETIQWYRTYRLKLFKQFPTPMPASEPKILVRE